MEKNSKEKLKELKYFILCTIRFNSISYAKELGEYGIKYVQGYIPGVSVIDPSVMNEGILLLDDKPIARIFANSIIVRSIDFHDRYDALIRFIFTTLDVELHRFGSIWVGYPSPDAVPAPDVQEVTSQYQGEAVPPPGIDIAQLHRGNWETTTTTPTAPNWSTITTTSGTGTWGPNTTATFYGTSFPGTYNITGSFPSVTIPWNNEYADTSWMRAPEVNKLRNTPKNPILAQAQNMGISQAAMERNMRKGRRN